MISSLSTKKVALALLLLCVACHCRRSLATDPCNYNAANCNQYDSQGCCTKCSARYYFSAAGTCEKVSDQCRDYDPTSGKCTSCYDGYLLQSGGCVLASSAPPACQPNDDYCHEWDYTLCHCKVCSGYYWYNSKTQKCEQVSSLCKDYDTTNGRCTDCYSGYYLVDGQCKDNCGWGAPNCNQYDANGCCIKCSYYYYFDANGVCQQVSPDCNGYNATTGACTGCYGGFHLVSGKCVKNS